MSHPKNSRKRSLSIEGGDAAPSPKVRPLILDQVKVLSVKLPPSIPSPRINYSSESFAKVTLERYGHTQPYNDIPNPASRKHTKSLPSYQHKSSKGLSKNPPTPDPSQSPEKPSSPQNASPVHESSPDARSETLCFQIKDWVYTGTLWEVYRGTLSITNRSSHEVSIVMKVLRPDTFDRSLLEEDQSSDGLAAAYTFTREYDPASAVKAAYNEDTIYRQLAPMQGTIIPEYHGLFVSYQDANGIIDEGATLPKMMAILLEDLGNQVDPHDMLDDEYSMEECKRIYALYDKLHTQGQVAHGLPKTWHILRRKAAPEDHENHLVMVDFAHAKSLGGMTQEEKESAIQNDEGMLMTANQTWRE
ncbi:hypothetical protein V865_004934 [Kwoniella europaea PYCC6329]|uniref:Protein kinase domain-containing protein n=1 Tax=Kwoniella europaea PYCC6329 TaxID=1423913 RepID=A0AAX4KL08_9TREE